MIDQAFLEALKTEMPQLDWQLDAPMSRYTTLRVGGPADCVPTALTGACFMYAYPQVEGQAV